MAGEWEPKALHALKRIMALRRRDKMRVRNAAWWLQRQDTPRARLELMRAQEAARGSKVRARRLHDAWQSAVAIVYGEGRVRR